MVESLPGWFLVKSPTEIRDRLEVLLSRVEDLDPADAVRVRLLKGDWILCDTGDVRKARQELRQALRTGKLTDADEHYARALMCDQTGPALLHFKAALYYQRAHPRARHALVMTHLFRGEFAEGRRERAILEGVFPDDPVPRLAEAFVLLSEERFAEVRKEIARLTAGLDPDRAERTRRFWDQLIDLADFTLRAERQTPGTGMNSALYRLLNLKVPKDVSFRFNIPVVVWGHDRLNRYSGSFVTSGLVVLKGWGGIPLPEVLTRWALTSLEKDMEDGPEPIQYMMLGAARMSQSLGALNRKDPAAAWRESRRAADILFQGAEAATLTPTASSQYVCRLSAFAVDLGTLREFAAEPNQEIQEELKEIRRRVRATVPKLILEGRRFPRTRAEFLQDTMLRQVGLEYVEPLLRDWAIDQPDDATPHVRYVQALLHGGQPGTAFGYLESLLQSGQQFRTPDDARITLESLRNQARTKLLQTLKKDTRGGE
jgi:hypothetical protein